jgi:hypothetical protein
MRGTVDTIVEIIRSECGVAKQCKICSAKPGKCLTFCQTVTCTLFKASFFKIHLLKWDSKKRSRLIGVQIEQKENGAKVCKHEI